MTYTREQLRAKLIGEADQVRNSWILWNRMKVEDRNICLAGRQCISKDTPVTDAYLDDFNNILNTMQTYKSATPPNPPAWSDVMQEIGVLISLLWQWMLGLVKL